MSQFAALKNQDTIAYIGLGSNLDNPGEQLDRAIIALSNLPSSKLLACSGYYQSKPVGPQDQPDFVNAAVTLKTALSPTQLLQRLQLIEHNQGRIKKRRWGERTIDLDILLYGDLSMTNDHLTIPHREIANRDFVLQPLLELDCELTLPNGPTLSSLLSVCPDNQLQRIN